MFSPRFFLNETAGIEDWIRRVIVEGDDVLKTFTYFLTGRSQR
jgi:hypothetical protein